MKILVINCGSSSLKYQFLDMEGEKLLASGLVERIGIEGSRLKHEKQGQDKVVMDYAMEDHKMALNYVLEALMNEEHGVIKSVSEIDAVGHRVVHAGEYFSSSVVIDKEVIKALYDCAKLAPLHNPPNITGIEALQELLPEVPMVAVFDTAFHQTMPEHEYIYALDYKYYEQYKIRRYGFHGTSHRYVSQRAAEILGKKPEEVKIVVCHLGNGSSIAAVNGGKSVATSMGFTPLEGLAMGTRCGDIDPAIVTFLMDHEGLSVKEMDTILNKKSGVLGISGVSSDFRDIEGAANEGNKRAKLALDIFNYKVRRAIASYAAAMEGIDAVVFTAGIGENGIDNRRDILSGLGFLGIELDEEANKVRGRETLISKEGSRVKALVVPTNEELMIARDTLALVSK